MHEDSDQQPERGREPSTIAGRPNPASEIVYGEVDEGYDNEDQKDAHHAEPDEHV